MTEAAIDRDPAWIPMAAMRRIPFIAIALCALGTAGTTLAAQAPGSVAGSGMGGETQAPDERRDVVDGAVAGVLVGALAEQFGGRAVSVRLDQVEVLPSSIRDRIVSGTGRVSIGGDEDWIGFRFNTLYDTVLGSAAYPDIALGGIASGERLVPNDPMLIRQLDDTVVARLGEEFASQAVRLQLDSITTVEAGTRYLRINASGIADFGRDGTTPTQIEGLYDLRDRAWLRVNYELGPAPGGDGRVVFAGG